jgi:hypothetical protein
MDKGWPEPNLKPFSSISPEIRASSVWWTWAMRGHEPETIPTGSIHEHPGGSWEPKPPTCWLLD